jgi:hypothetical protein
MPDVTLKKVLKDQVLKFNELLFLMYKFWGIVCS